MASGEDEPIRLSTILETAGSSSAEEIPVFAGADPEAILEVAVDADFTRSGEQNGIGKQAGAGDQAGEREKPARSFVRLGDESTVRLFDDFPEELRLEFPHEVSLRLVSRDAGRGWDVEEIDGGDRVARIVAEPEGTASLRWREGPRRSTTGGLLRHGRLVSADGRIVYLRPAVVAAPGRLGLRSADRSVDWELGGGPPARSAEVEADLSLPDTIDVGWVEPIDLTNPRRGEGLAVLSLADDETVAVAVRIDFRWTRRLSVQLRYAARLDAGLPWQTITAETFDSARRAVADRGIAIGARVAAIEAAYQRADSSGRRQIRPRRDAARRVADSIRVATTRMRTLDRLLSAIEASGRIDVRAGVSWPDDRQPVLTTQRGPHGATRADGEGVEN